MLKLDLLNVVIQDLRSFMKLLLSSFFTRKSISVNQSISSTKETIREKPAKNKNIIVIILTHELTSIINIYYKYLQAKLTNERCWH